MWPGSVPMIDAAAICMRSEPKPWTGLFSAFRSAREIRAGLFEYRSLSQRTRPIGDVTKPRSCARRLAFSCH